MSEPQQVESPCTGVCRMDEGNGYCQGCWRTRDEIALWGRADRRTRLEILDRLHERKAAQGLKQRRTTRRRRQKQETGR